MRLEDVTRNPAFWERYLPSFHSFRDEVFAGPENRAARFAKRLALFGTSQADVEVMDEWLYGPDYLTHPEKASQEILEQVDRKYPLDPNIDPNVLRYLRKKEIEELMEDRPKPPVRAFRFELGGHALVVSVEPQRGPTFELVCPGRAEPLCLGYAEGHFAMPALRWREAERLADRVRAARPGTWEARSARLLFARAAVVAVGDDISLFRAFLTRAFAETESFSEERSVELGLTYVPPSAEPEPECEWRRDRELGWVNNAVTSERNPENGLWKTDDFLEARRFLED